jgi:SAM-dependent methyltransferase
MLVRYKSMVPVQFRKPIRQAYDYLHAKTVYSWTAQSFYCDLLDACDWILGRDKPLVPPRKLIRGIGGYFEVGHQFLGYFRDLAGLQPDEAVLDIGCGVGRMALPLTGYLSPRGRYDGFDIVRENVNWCRRHIASRFSNFHFRHVNLYNREYNPRGKEHSSTFVFPYSDSSFDFVFLTSVFTHMLPVEVCHYISEIQRVLKPGGRCFTTVYLLNEESNRLIDSGRSLISLQPAQEGFRVHSHVVPETCVALDEELIDRFANSVGLIPQQPKHYGRWCGRDDGLDFQDILLLKKPTRT